MRFFTFPEVHTDPVSLVEPGMGKDLTIVRAGKTYYMAKDRMVDLGHGRVSRSNVDTLADPDMLSVQFDIDPSVSKIQDEHMKLASYMRDSILTIDIYDADSQFIFATAKLPMFELLRQKMSNVVRAKEIEAAAPDSADFRASIQVIMSNMGRQYKEQLKLISPGASLTDAEIMRESRG